MEDGRDRFEWRRSGLARSCLSLTQGLDGRAKGDRVEASFYFNAQTISETDMDPSRCTSLVGDEFDKCPEMGVVGLLVLKAPAPMIESVPIDPVFPAECRSAQAAFVLLAYQASPICRSFLLGHDGPPPYLLYWGDRSREIQGKKDGLVRRLHQYGICEVIK